MQPDQKKTLLFAAIILVAAFWPKIGPVVQPYIDKVTNVVVASKNPFSDSSLRVMVVYPTETPLDAKQDAIISSTKIRSLVETAGGKFTAFDDQTEFMGEGQKVWQEAIEKNKSQKMPYIAIGNGAKGTVEDLPADISETETLIRKYL